VMCHAAPSGSFMPHRATGAEASRAARAPVKTKKVSAGSRPVARQFETACGVTSASFAAGEVPPSASMTSEAVPSLRIPIKYRNSVVCQEQEILYRAGRGKIALSPRMADSPEPTSLKDIAERLILTREALGKNQAELCRITGISTQKWNNAEAKRNRLSIPDATRLCRATGVTMDWIYRGVRTGLPALILEALAKAENTPRRPRRRA